MNSPRQPTCPTAERRVAWGQESVNFFPKSCISKHAMPVVSVWGESYIANMRWVLRLDAVRLCRRVDVDLRCEPEK